MSYPSRAPRAGVFRDIHAIYDLTEVTAGLPMPSTSPARASFDYRHIVREQDARAAVACAVAALSRAFGAVFSERTEPGGDGTPRYLLEALLPSGLSVVIISRVANAGSQDPAGTQPELAGAAA